MATTIKELWYNFYSAQSGMHPLDVYTLEQHQRVTFEGSVGRVPGELLSQLALRWVESNTALTPWSGASLSDHIISAMAQVFRPENLATLTTNQRNYIVASILGLVMTIPA